MVVVLLHLQMLSRFLLQNVCRYLLLLSLFLEKRLEKHMKMGYCFAAVTSYDTMGLLECSSEQTWKRSQASTYSIGPDRLWLRTTAQCSPPLHVEQLRGKEREAWA